jgi:hypothetical protein
MTHGRYQRTDKRVELEELDDREDDISDEELQELMQPDMGYEDYMEASLSGLFDEGFDFGNWFMGLYDDESGETMECKIINYYFFAYM